MAINVANPTTKSVNRVLGVLLSQLCQDIAERCAPVLRLILCLNGTAKKSKHRKKIHRNSLARPTS